MQDYFDDALGVTLPEEGGFSDHPQDPGGATMRGVTQKVYDAYRDALKLARRSVKLITDDELMAIYRRGYWDAIRGDELPGGVDLAAFDAAVNSGPKQAVKWLQRAAGMPEADVDGAMGPKTLAAVRAAAPVAVVNGLCDRRLAMLQSLSTWPTFGKGWTRRVSNVRAAALKLAAGTRPAAPAAPAPAPAPVAPPVQSSEGGGFMLTVVKPIVLGMVRHGLTIAGTALVAKGIGDAAMVDQVVGAVIAVLGVVWSAVDKTPSAK